MSVFECKVVPIQLDPHPNADTLSIIRIFDAFVCVGRTVDWKDVDKAVFVPPDSIVPDTPEFAFLNGNRRIRARKIRGIYSQGLLLPCPEGSDIGDNVAEKMGITHYEPPIEMDQGTFCEDPHIPGPTYDLESWFKYKNVLNKLKVKHGELIVTITEKLHGTNSRFTFQDGKMWCGSKERYRHESESCLYWKAMRASPWIESFCRLNPNAVLYGEVFGWVQTLRYGALRSDQPMFRMFDVFEDGQFLPWTDNIARGFSDRVVPVLYCGSYSDAIVEKLMNGESTINGADHIREGIVVKPLQNFWDPSVGRVILKAVSSEYLEKYK